MHPFTIGAYVVILLALGLIVYSLVLYVRGRRKSASVPQMPKPAPAAKVIKSVEPKNVTIKEIVRYRQRRRLTSRKAQVTGFGRNGEGNILIRLRDALGNRFSVVESRIL